MQRRVGVGCCWCVAPCVECGQADDDEEEAKEEEEGARLRLGSARRVSTCGRNGGRVGVGVGRVRLWSSTRVRLSCGGHPALQPRLIVSCCRFGARLGSRFLCRRARNSTQTPTNEGEEREEWKTDLYIMQQPSELVYVFSFVQGLPRHVERARPCTDQLSTTVLPCSLLSSACRCSPSPVPCPSLLAPSLARRLLACARVFAMSTQTATPSWFVQILFGRYRTLGNIQWTHLAVLSGFAILMVRRGWRDTARTP